MAERRAGNELEDLVAKGVRFQVTRGEDSYPVVRATIPVSKQVIGTEDLVCKGCQQQGCVVTESEDRFFANKGVRLHIEGIRRVEVAGCRLSLMSHDEYRDAEDKFIQDENAPTNSLFDECIQGKLVSEVGSGDIIQAVLNVLGEHKIAMRPPVLSRVRSALVANRRTSVTE